MHSQKSASVPETDEVCFDYSALGKRWRKHPKTDHRDELQSYLDTAKEGRSPESLTNAFALHRRFPETGDMRDTRKQAGSGHG
jgi:hypothetical protein